MYVDCKPLQGLFGECLIILVIPLCHVYQRKKLYTGQDYVWALLMEGGGWPVNGGHTLVQGSESFGGL